MAGRQSGWSQAALLQFLLGMCLTVMPPTQARSLRFVTLVMGDESPTGSPKLKGQRAAMLVEGGVELVLWGRGLTS